jgi:hypothetical protein
VQHIIRQNGAYSWAISKTADTVIQYDIIKWGQQNFKKGISPMQMVSPMERGRDLKNKRGLIILDRIQGVSTLLWSRDYSWGVI